MRIYDRILKARSDLTEWVIHWTRWQFPVFPIKKSSDTLRKIIQEGYLLPSFSVRKAKPTIYGPRPAVCFTEQPLLEFARYVKHRDDVFSVSGYGVVVHKHDLYADGGLPVVSGLGCPHDAEPGDSGYDPAKRVLKASCGLPLDEQYRYVALNPNKGDYPIDWTHEREWRWSLQHWNQGGEPMPGFPLAGSGWSSNRDKHKGRFGFVVPNEDAAAKLAQFIASVAPNTELITPASIAYRDRYIPALKAARIYVLETIERECSLGKMDYAKAETHP